MKKASIFKEKLLLSQEEIAMLLGVTRTQWSMFEIGQRDIPSSAKLKLATILKHVNNLSKATKKEFPYQKIQELKKQKVLQEELENNKLQKLKLQRKLERLQLYYKQAENTLQFVALLQEKEKQTELETLVLQTIKSKALQILDKNGWHLQTKFQQKWNALEEHRKLLELELGKYSESL